VLTRLKNEIANISADEISTTRRSAALPHSVLALVAGDQMLLDKVFDKLIVLASVDSASSDTTKVHAYNILKIVLLDSRQAKLFDRYLERAVVTALGAFTSPR
jgi:hypothetical protein